jgi:hypothetical protein
MLPALCGSWHSHWQTKGWSLRSDRRSSSVTATSHHTQRRGGGFDYRAALRTSFSNPPSLSRKRRRRPKLGSCPFRCLKRRHTPCHPFLCLHPRFAVSPIESRRMLHVGSSIERDRREIGNDGYRTAGEDKRGYMHGMRTRTRPAGTKAGGKYGLFTI